MVLLPFVAHDLTLTTKSFGVLLFLGLFQIGLPYVLFARGLKYVTATQASLTGMLEPIANPLWVFLLLGEQPSRFAIAGAAVVLARSAGTRSAARRTRICPPWTRLAALPRSMAATFDLIEPATGQRLATVPERTTAEDVDRAVRAADRSFSKGEWRKMHPRERGRVMLRLSALIRDNADELARSRRATSENRSATRATKSASLPIASSTTPARRTKSADRPSPGPNGVLMTFREPVGVCGIIVPWNFPIAITSWKVSPALAMGNSVVLKPAEQTPMTAMRLEELAREAGIPEGVFHGHHRSR